MSKIEWTESTWNPVTGCTKISAGCNHCYAERMAKRLHGMGQANYQNGFAVTLHEQALQRPLRWHKSRMVFVNSMSDLFHEDVPTEFILQVFRTMQKASHHQFQVLTKRAKRLESLANTLPWPDNVWMGVTVEKADYSWRIDSLRSTPARVRFLSLEPLLGPLPNLDLRDIDWVIVGGESGPGSRPIEEKWVVNIREQCQQSHSAFFFKQWGGINKKKAGRILQGRTWNEMPLDFARPVHT